MTTQATNRQLPDHSIMDINGKQAYLGNQFVVGLKGTSVTGTSETNLLLISNPAAVSTASKALFALFKKVWCLTASNNVTIRFYLNPTVTGAGTPVTPVNCRPSNTNTSIVNVTTSPTTSANGTFLEFLYSPYATPDMSSILSILDPGQSMLITAQCSATSTVGFEFVYYEI